jgi:hypothetical protein
METKMMKVIPLLFLVQLIALSSQCGARNINVEIGASWPEYSTSYILELSEFLFDQSPASYWGYVDSMCLISEKVDAGKVRVGVKGRVILNHDYHSYCKSVYIIGVRLRARVRIIWMICVCCLRRVVMDR